jgi:hypothetical protein
MGRLQILGANAAAKTCLRSPVSLKTDSLRAHRSDTELAANDRRHLSAEDFYGVQHFFVGQRRDTHLEGDARNTTENFIHVKDLFRDRIAAMSSLA